MKLDHVGFVVSSLEASIDSFKCKFSYAHVSPIFEDKIQNVRVVFLYDDKHSHRMELIEPLSEQSPVYKFLQNQGGVNHIAYKVDDIHVAIKEVEQGGGTVICPPVPGAGHGNALISFFYYNSDCPRGFITEYVECKG